MKSPESRPQSAGSRPVRINRRGVGAVFAAGALTGAAVAGIIASNAESSAVANNQPGCDVEAPTPATLTGMGDHFAGRGANISGGVQVLYEQGGRLIERPASEDRFGSKGLRGGDTVRYEHFDPKVCIEVGGTVLVNEVQLVGGNVAATSGQQIPQILPGGDGGPEK